MKKQMSETFLAGAILAVTGGYLDAYTYVCRGHVFANAQTGNIVLLGVKAAAGEWLGALYYAVPILAFVLGIFIAELIRKRFRTHPNIHWRQIVVLIEAVVLFGIGFLPLGRMDMLANVLVAFVCSLQVESFRKVNGSPYATTMCTGNLRSASEQLFLYSQTKERRFLRSSMRYYGIIAFFIVGACVGAVLTGIWAEKAVFAASVALVGVFLLMFFKEEADTREGKA